MRSEDIIAMIRRDRHDLMNDIQLLEGYAAMDKVSHVQQKLGEMVSHYQEERKLLNLGAPDFALWLLRCQSIHNHIRISYVIHDHISERIQSIDQLLLQISEQVVEAIRQNGTEMELYKVILEIGDVDDMLEMIWSIHGPLEDIETFLKMHINEAQKQWMVDRKTDRQLLCKLRIPYE